MKATLNPIGHIQTPYQKIEDCPNNVDLNGPSCGLILKEEFYDGILGLKPGQNILILYWFENTDRDVLKQRSRIGSVESVDLVGTFALRSPHRPNPIGAAVLPITAIEKNVVFVNGLDCLNGTPLVDIKPAIMLEN